MLKVRSKFDIFPRAELMEDIAEFTASDWGESQNLGFDFMSGSDCYGAENALDRPSITTDCGANVSAGVELKIYGIGINAHVTYYISQSMPV